MNAVRTILLPMLFKNPLFWSSLVGSAILLVQSYRRRNEPKASRDLIIIAIFFPIIFAALILAKILPPLN